MRLLPVAFITTIIFLSCNSHEKTKVKDVKLVEISSDTPPPLPEPPPRPPSDFVVTAGEIARDLKQNQKAALAKYHDKFIEISGIVTEVRNEDYSIVIVLKDPKTDASVECIMMHRRTAKNITVGSSIIVYAMCVEMDGKPVLKSYEYDLVK